MSKAKLSKNTQNVKAERATARKSEAAFKKTVEKRRAKNKVASASRKANRKK